MTEAVYTHKQIESHWKAYKAANWYRFLKDGKPTVRTTMPNMEAERVANLTMAKASLLVSFPKYLEEINA